MFKQSAPMFKQSAPMFKQSAPMFKQSAPMFKQSHCCYILTRLAPSISLAMLSSTQLSHIPADCCP
jgi:hypothetical protein